MQQDGRLIFPAESIPPFSPCVQCGRCSSGCPVAFESPHTPRRILRFLQIGQIKTACKSPFPWLCAMCQACTVRCPRGVNISEIMLALRRIGQVQGWVTPPYFYEAFKKMLTGKKKVSERRLGFTMALHKIPLHPLEDALLFCRLWQRGKIR